MNSFRAKLDESDLSEEDAAALGIEHYTQDQVAALGSNFQPLEGLYIPYFDAQGQARDFHRVRYLELRRGFEVARHKYVQPAGAAPMAYFPRVLPWAKLTREPAAPLVITEGELKACCIAKQGYAAIGIGGVYNWRSTRNGDDLIPDLASIAWEGRRVTVVFDSDARSNPQVQLAMSKLSLKLLEVGAVVYQLVVPSPPDTKLGADDYIVRYGAGAFAELLDAATEHKPSADLWAFDAEVAYIAETDAVVELDTGQLLGLTTNNFRVPRYANRHTTVIVGDGENVKQRRESTAKLWLEWPHRRTVQRMTFKPGEPRITPQNEYNLWRGWGVEARRGSMALWRKLVGHLFDGDREKIAWLERWLAHQIQHPGVKMYSAVLVWGQAQGTGKSLLGYTFKRLFKERHAQEVHTERLLSPFNAWAAQTQFVLGEEIGIFDGQFKDRRSAGGFLKGLITREVIAVNRKYQPEYEVPDCIAYYLTSNHEDAFYIEPGDRRFFVHEVSNPPMDQAFYTEYDAWLRGPGPASLRYYLEHLELDTFDPKAPAMLTEAKRDMVAGGMSNLDAWAAALALDSREALGQIGAASACEVWTAAELAALYTDPVNGRGASPNWMGRALRRAGFVPRKQQAVHGALQTLYAVRNRKHWDDGRFKIPKSKEMRAHYERHHPQA